MNYGFIRVACASPELVVANCVYNADKIIDYARLAAEQGVSLIVFPELSVTSYSCGDLFFQKTLQKSAIPRMVYSAGNLTPLSAISFACLSIVITWE